MPYLLSKNNTSNLLIDKTGESIYYRRYPIKYNQRAVVIAKSTNNEYAASLDEYSNIHIIYKNSTNSLVHLYERNNKFEVTNLLDDYENSYQISNIKYLYHQKNYIFYCAYNPYERTSDLIFHSFKDTEKTEPQSLFSVPTLSSPYECILDNKIIYLLCQVLNEKGNYELNLYKYNITSQEWEEFETIVNSVSPFMDYSLCLCENKICVTYVERDTNNTIYFTSKDDTWNEPVKVYSTKESISPVIFIYNNILWINFKENNKLKYSLSCNSGATFIEPKLCSAQNPEARHFYFYGYNKGNLSGNKFFGYIYQYPILAVLSQVDTDNILLSSQTNLEIKSIIGNFTSNEMYNITTLKKELEEQKQVQQNITKQYDNLAKMAKELQNQAKMWKLKTSQAEQEIKKLKKKLRKAYITPPNKEIQENEIIKHSKKSDTDTLFEKKIDIEIPDNDIPNIVEQIAESKDINSNNKKLDDPELIEHIITHLEKKEEYGKYGTEEIDLNETID
ncbi:hypothetical protein SH1V18_19090 [Vallitalea longa]|uniref:Uncharacterized protein n=1 Tax=Vallitalea longa TaxID=2936439 RepID=A0A9W5YA93_9FIRM|nr:hypothetical protein [Vallitalea longa]GKX29429.1 hypothetical protein SH1V18_19090 [Vallitalea longa]